MNSIWTQSCNKHNSHGARYKVTHIQYSNQKASIVHLVWSMLTCRVTCLSFTGCAMIVDAVELGKRADLERTFMNCCLASSLRAVIVGVAFWFLGVLWSSLSEFWSSLGDTSLDSSRRALRSAIGGSIYFWIGNTRIRIQYVQCPTCTYCTALCRLLHPLVN